MIQKDIIVVGGGIAGLTATLSLANWAKTFCLLKKTEAVAG